MSLAVLESSVRILLPPSAVLVVNLFRRFDRFRRSYNQVHLDAAAEALRTRVGERHADAIMSDAIMMDNELRLRTAGRLAFLSDASPTASTDELALVGIVAAMQAGQSRKAGEYALQLEILQARSLIMLAYRLGARLAEAGISLDPAALEIDIDAAPKVKAQAPSLRIVGGKDAWS
jgi:hypothetical protein